jgi:HK97 family phage portal protein
MGILSRINRPKAARELSYNNPAHDHWYESSKFFGVQPSSSGVFVNPDNAFRLITVQNCVRVRSSTIAQLPLHLKIKNGRSTENADDHSLYNILHDQPNDWMSAAEFWGMAEAFICLRGNFYAYKICIEGRPIQQLIPMKADQVQKVEQLDDYSLIYHVKMQDNVVRQVPGRKMLHLRGLTLDGITGVNPIEYARETIGLGIASKEFLGRYFGKGLHPSAVIKHPQALNTQAFENRRKALKERYEGLGKSHEFMLLDEAMDITFPEIKLVDAQYIEQMKLTEAQICGLYRVPLMLVQAGDKAPTYASAEQFMLAFSIYGVAPDCRNYEQAVRRDLLTNEEKKKYFAKFNINALLRGDFKTRMEGYQLGINSEMMSPNEARELEDMNPYAGGDEFRTRTSTVKESPGKTEDKGGEE